MGSNTLTVDFASRYNYYIYHNLIRSLLLRKQGKGTLWLRRVAPCYPGE